MVFFIGGVQPKTVVLEKQSRSCPFCGNVDVQLKRVDHYISIFFIPIIRIKKGNPFLICENCHSVLDKDGTKAGFREDRRRCRYCGNYLEASFSFCPFCGKHI